MSFRSSTTRRAGRSLNAARNETPRILPWLAVLVSVGLIFVSITLNGRMAYRSADTVLDAWIYAVAAGLGDALKAYAPFAAFAGYRNRDWVAVVAAGLVFVVISAFTFSAEFGFALLHRTERQAERATQVERRSDLRERYTRVRDTLSSLGSQRSLEEIDAALAAKRSSVVIERNRSVADVSQNCTLVRWETREACAEIARLVQERALSSRVAMLTRELAELAEKMDQIRLYRGGDDPQSEGLRVLLSWLGDVPNMDKMLALFVAAMIELGSGLGLYISMTPWRSAAPVMPQAENSKRTWVPRRRVVAAVGARGSVAEFAAFRLVSLPVGVVAARDAYKDYKRWCETVGVKPYAFTPWRSQFFALAGELGIQVAGQGDDIELQGVGLAPL